MIFHRFIKRDGIRLIENNVLQNNVHERYGILWGCVIWGRCSGVGGR